MKNASYVNIKNNCRRIGMAYLFLMLTIALTVLSTAFLFPTCSAQGEEEPINIVKALCDSEIRLPIGELYFSEAPEGSDSFLSKELLFVSFGIPLEFCSIEKAALRFSVIGKPCEFAVFLCQSDNAAEDVALFCRQRIALLKRNSHAAAAAYDMTYNEYMAYLLDARVVTSGRYVALIISSDPSNAEQIFRRAI